MKESKSLTFYKAYFSSAINFQKKLEMKCFNEVSLRSNC